MDATRITDETPATPQRDTPMSCEIVRDLIEGQHLTRGEIADLLNVAVSSTYHYTEATELTYSKLRTLFRRSSSDELRRRFLDDLTAGGDFAYTFRGLPTDVDGDGDTDADDLLAAAVHNSSAVADLLVDVHAAMKAMQDGRTRNRSELREQIDTARAELDRLSRIEQAIPQEPTRRKARPLTTPPKGGA